MTHILDSELIQKEWNLTNIEDKNILQDFDNRLVVKFKADEGQFVCKLIGGSISNEQFQKQTLIYDFLNDRSFSHAPKLVKTKSGNNFYFDGQKLILVMEYIEGQKPQGTIEDYKQLADILGTLNNFSYYPHPAVISVSAIRPHFADVAGKLPAHMRQEYLLLANALPDIDALPNSLIHFEANLQNAIQKADGTIIIVDWDEAGMGSTILDPGYFLINCFISEDLKFDSGMTEVFYSTYLSKHALSTLELSCIFDASLFHALRYIVWGDVEKRWQRIKWAVKNRGLLEKIVRA